MIFITLCFVLYFQNNDKRNSNLFLKSSNTLNNKDLNFKLTGIDERYIYCKNETNKAETLYKIIENFEKKKILNTLENNNISINTKLKLLEDNSIKPLNLKAGGLMQDFDFTID